MQNGAFPTTMTKTPREAWIACALSTISFPLCVYPLRTLCIQRNLLLQSHSRRWHLFMIALWATMLISHLGLITYSVTAATEVRCRDGSLSDYGWTVGPPTCQRRFLLSIINVLEYMTAPCYPMFILSTYLQLRPTKSKKGQRRIQLVIVIAVLVMGSLSAVLIFSSVVDTLLVVSLNAEYQTIAHQADILYHSVFDLWAGSLILLSGCSLVSAIRLIPFLTIKQQSSSGHLSRFRTLAVARMSTASTTSKPTPVSVGPTLSHPGHQGSTGSSRDDTAGGSISGTATAVPPAPPDVRSKAVHSCLRQLKGILLLLSAVLVGNVAMIAMVRAIPDVLFTVIGWLSCRIVSVSLFAAINLIRKTVIARRKVPNPAVGSLATEWQGVTARKT